MGGAGWESGAAIKTDTNGNVIVAGSFSSNFDFDPGSGSTVITRRGSASDAFLEKFDADGNMLWVKQMGGDRGNVFNVLETDAQGNIYAGGEFTGTVDFDPGSAIFNLTSTMEVLAPIPSTDVAITKLDANGNLLWAKAIGGVSGEALRFIKIDSDSNIIIGGLFRETADFNPGTGVYNLTAQGTVDSFIIKLDTNGNFIWAKRLGNENDTRLICAHLDNNANIYIAGTFIGLTDVNPGDGTYNLTPSPLDINNQQFSDIFILKLNEDGAFVWAGKIGGTLSESCDALVTDNDGNVYISGVYMGSPDMDPGNGELLFSTPNLTQAMYLMKLDTGGALLWANNIETTQSIDPNSIKLNSNNEIFVSGSYSGTATFPSLTNPVIITSAGGNDIFVTKFNSTGNALWARSMGGTEDDVANDIQVDDSGIIYITGSFIGTCDFDPDAPATNKTSNGWGDMFLQKLGPASLGTDKYNITDAWSVYPNLSNGLINCSFKNNLIGSELTIYTPTGQRVNSFVINNTTQQLCLSTGVYILKLENEGGTSNKRVIIY